MRKISAFFKNVRRELKKVQWPNRRELTTYTTIVVVTVVLVAAIISIVDFGYQQVLRFIFVR
ncbi:MAG: preprotein translocase subunit SecE [Firmicutes bacterium]|nr:preprotein translocase subunit SecE [Bacillota bacterium]HOB35403.1 preprotein translocase subunit SecE [Bacillota bacterium]HPZ90961.1 preprotein translocase subunit SecE [Bacillota bacterium]HQE01963.1 preprotein translocase subunit SecE [Bacillota bacterium]